MLDSKRFSTFNDLRKECYTIVAEQRECLHRIIFQKYKIFYTDDTSKRDYFELMEKHNAEKVKNEELNRDECYINGELVAWIKREVEIVFQAGTMLVEIEYWIKE